MSTSIAMNLLTFNPFFGGAHIFNIIVHISRSGIAELKIKHIAWPQYILLWFSKVLI